MKKYPYYACQTCGDATPGLLGRLFDWTFGTTSHRCATQDNHLLHAGAAVSIDLRRLAALTAANEQLVAEKDGLYADLIGQEHRLGTKIELLTDKLTEVQKERDYWREKWESLETTRASHCEANETENKALKAKITAALKALEGGPQT